MEGWKEGWDSADVETNFGWSNIVEHNGVAEEGG